ncbi:LOW QUALITY PROTEIN: hypothetical protein Cgig2_034109 [Carnegiea gigantea]|uniref:ABC transporter domain-containing protein n=1 Tax=Carnegiea gigantea TaxID=171969 RepID=A0A9Q1QAY4_9CARY|nr:LOW QUALITY PROTEIN: hypothetical protein Cgig2_034109 [Carnegiea gigantea]
MAYHNFLCFVLMQLLYGMLLFLHGTNNFGDIIKAFFILMMTAIAVAETLALTPEIVKGLDALGMVFSILERKAIINPDDHELIILANIKGDIEFQDVSFKYSTRPYICVLQNLNLKIPSGKTVALVGTSGSGKSTMISLIMRFYDPSSGSILIDGHDIRKPQLFSTTIYENIRYGNNGATEIEIMKSAKVANAHEFISKMPDGYATLAIRDPNYQKGKNKGAILKDPSILLLDEATSTLDSSSEKVVQEALTKVMRRRTNIIVAHRFLTIRDADSIIVMHQGKVVEIGNHKELIGSPRSLYA